MLPKRREEDHVKENYGFRVYLERAGVFASPGRGQFQITPRGREILANPSEVLDIKYMERYPEFREFRSKRQESALIPVESVESGTPEETLEAAYQSIRAGLASELLERVKSCTPRFFELLVVELLLKIGVRPCRRERRGDR